MSRVCRARGTRILYSRLPSAEALGFLISSRRAGLRRDTATDLSLRTRTQRPGRVIRKPTVSTVGKRSFETGVPRERHMPRYPNPQRTSRHHRRHRPAPGAFLRHHAGVLAELAKPL